MSLIQSTGQLNVNSNFVRNVLDPVLEQDAATKHYVDSNSGSTINLFSAGGTSIVTLTGGSGPNLYIKGLIQGTGISFQILEAV